MLHREFLGKITINNYIRKVQISKAQREKYYEWDGTTIKCRSKKLLQKYIKKSSKTRIIIANGNVTPLDLKKEFNIIEYRGDKVYAEVLELHETLYYNIIDENLTKKQLIKPIKYILCTKYCDLDTGHNIYIKILANETQAGKPKDFIINGNYIYNHTASPFTTGKVFATLKEMYYIKFKSINPSILIGFRQRLLNNYPLIIEMEIQDTIKSKFDNTKNNIGRRWDVGNRADPYMKTFLDFISNNYVDKDNNILFNALLEDDDRLHVTSGNNALFTPIEEEETPRLIFRFYKDIRPIWQTILNT